MIQPNRMMDMAMPMKLAVILWRSAKRSREVTVFVGGDAKFLHMNASDYERKRKNREREREGGFTHGERATHPALLSWLD